MVRRSTRRFKPPGFKHTILESKMRPRRSKQITATANLEVNLQILQEAAVAEGAMIPVPVLQELATSCCAVPPEEVTEDILNPRASYQ
jgi:hypothetical protein